MTTTCCKCTDDNNYKVTDDNGLLQMYWKGTDDKSLLQMYCKGTDDSDCKSINALMTAIVKVRMTMMIKVLMTITCCNCTIKVFMTMTIRVLMIMDSASKTGRHNYKLSQQQLL